MVEAVEEAGGIVSAGEGAEGVDGGEGRVWVGCGE